MKPKLLSLNSEIGVMIRATNLKKLLMAAAAIIAAAAIFLTISEKTSTSHRSGEQSDHREDLRTRTLDRTETNERLRRERRGKSKSEILIENIPSIVERGLDADPATRQEFIEVLPEMTPEQIGRMLSSWPDKTAAFFTNKVADLLVDKNDPRYLMEVLEHVALKTPGRDGLLEELGERSDIFSPENIGSVLEGVTSKELKQIGSGLADRISRMPESERSEKVAEYFSKISDPEITNALSATLMADLVKKDPEAAKQWLLDQDGLLVKEGDGPMLKHLAKSDIHSAIDFANQLIERNDSKRASAAIETIGNSYRSADPKGAYTWAVSLPRTISSRNQVIASTFSTICGTDASYAEEILSKESDPKQKAFLEQIKKSLPAR